MIALTAGKTIEILLGGAVTAHQLEVVSSWTDVDPAASPQVVSPAGNNLVTADATPVTAVAAPAGTVARGVDHLSVYNADTSPATVTLRLNNGSAVRRLATVTLQPGETLTYSGRMGWLTLDGQGAVKSTGQAILLAGSPVVGGAANAVLREDAGQFLAADSGLTFAAGVFTITQGGVSSVVTQTGAATTINDAITVQLTIAGAPMVTVTATQVQLGNSYLIVGTTGLTIATVPYVWPGADGAGVLTSNGAGVLSWAAPASPLPANAAGLLANDGAGTLSWAQSAGPLAWTATTFGAFGAALTTQPVPAGLSGGFTGTGNAITADTAFQGGIGTQNYTIDEIVHALKLLGWINS